MLDSKLFKALRAGGLGHKAAAMLSDRENPYALHRVPPGEADAAQLFEVKIDNLSIITDYLLYEQGGGFWTFTLPLAVGRVLEFSYFQFNNDGVTTPDALLSLNIFKLADGNGTPVSGVGADYAIQRSNNVVDVSQPITGFTVAHNDTAARGVKLTTTAAGHYAFNVTLQNEFS